MNTAQKIHYIQSEYDEQDRQDCAVLSLQLAIINDFKTEGFTGSRFIKSEQTTGADVVSEACEGVLADLIFKMHLAKESQDWEGFRDASFAVGNELAEIFNNKTYQLAQELYFEKENI